MIFQIFLIVLEYALRDYPCLNNGSIIVFEFCDKKYKLKVLKTEPQAKVIIFRGNINIDITNKLNEPDIDSSDEEIKLIIKVGKTISGKITEIFLDPEPIHSTFAKREKGYLAGMSFRTRQIFDVKENKLPKPPQSTKEKK